MVFFIRLILTLIEHSALLEAMEQQRISIAKAGLVCSLPARASVIAAANPVGGHYKYTIYTLLTSHSNSKSVSENLKMNSALLSRFDLVFILLDKADAQMDAHISEHIMKVHSGAGGARGARKWAAPGSQEGSQDTDEDNDIHSRIKIDGHFDPIPPSLLRKYVSYARKYCHPVLTPEAAGVLQGFYLDLREKYRSNESIPITTRQLESMIRLSEARAKAYGSSITLEN